jgi:spore coat polysaccharide biosynthesis predicted glycosyltransferase SpsG
MHKYLISSLCFTIACAAILPQQQDLATRVHKATVACTALSVTVNSAQKVKVCSQALLCQSTAKSAAEALQAANIARSTGTTDVAAEAKAAGLDVLADAACKQGGW